MQALSLFRPEPRLRQDLQSPGIHGTEALRARCTVTSRYG